MKKISLRFTLWVSLPLIFAFGLTILAITSFLNTQIMEEKHKVAGQKLEIANSQMSSLVGTVRALHGSLCRDEKLKELMYLQLGTEITPAVMQNMSDICGEYRSRDTSLLVSILPISLEGNVLNNIYSQDSDGSLTNKTGSFERFLDSLAYGGLFTADNAGTLTYYGGYFDMGNLNKLGYIAINIRASRFFYGLPEVLGPSFSQIYVLDEDNRAVFEFSKEPLGEAFPDEILHISRRLDNRLLINGHTFLVYSRMVEAYPGWHIVGMVDYEDMMRQTGRTSMLVAGIFVLTACLLIGVCFFIARKITNPILRMNQAMLQMSGGVWPEPVESKTVDEMHSLITGFNDMVESVRRLTEGRIAEQEEKRRIETSMLQGKLDLLQSQINPHFIHNTLNTLKYMALKEENTELYETIVSFNNLLRGSISSDSRFATVEEELGYLESYVHIQKKRYGDEIMSFHAVSDPEAMGALLPRMILQPLVENALFHGILPTRRTGRIDVTVMAEEHMLFVSISDNGQGINISVLESLLDGTYRNTRGYTKIGLRNVMDRIRLYYNDAGRFYISSQPGYGTLIMFKIPCIFEEMK